MNKLFRILSVIFVVALISLGSKMLYCDDGAQQAMEFRGQVQEIDWVGSFLTVEGADEMTFFVPPGTKIIYGPETISLSDIDQDDYVLVKYTDNPNERPTAVRISVNKNYPLF